MSTPEILLIVGVGVAAGIINTVVGSGTLVTFPALLAVGLPPVSANVANNIGLAPGSVAGAIGYRSELHAPRRTIVGLSMCACLGGITGAVLLIVLPSTVFTFVAPILIAVAIVLVIFQPRIDRLLHPPDSPAATGYGGIPIAVCVVLTSAYGGYFGAGQGVILLSLMSVLIPQTLQRINALKNVLQGVDNLTSAAVFILIYTVRWDAVLALAAGAIIGGLAGARIAKQLPENIIRIIVVVLGVIGLAYLIAK